MTWHRYMKSHGKQEVLTANIGVSSHGIILFQHQHPHVQLNANKHLCFSSFSRTPGRITPRKPFHYCWWLLGISISSWKSWVLSEIRKGNTLYNAFLSNMWYLQLGDNLPQPPYPCTIHPQKYAYGSCVDVFVSRLIAVNITHILWVNFPDTWTIRFPQSQWSKPNGYGIINHTNQIGTDNMINKTKHNTIQRIYHMSSAGFVAGTGSLS